MGNPYRYSSAALAAMVMNELVRTAMTIALYHESVKVQARAKGVSCHT